MSLSDCPECWNTPCTCGYEYRNETNEELTRIIVGMLLYKQKSDREVILKLIDDRLYGDLKKPQIDISKLELSNHG